MEEKEFVQIVMECKTMAYAAKRIGMSYSSFVRKAKKLGCYSPNPGGKGTSKRNGNGISLTEILEGKHPSYQTYKLKVRLVKEGILEDKCSECGWDKKPQGSMYSTCELDHINGNPCDHHLENLRILCPNCHSLTETYRFRRGKTNGL